MLTVNMLSTLLIVQTLITIAFSATNPCGSYWSYYDGSCYRLIRSSRTHSSALEYCQKFMKGAGLADIQSERQNDFIENHVVNGTVDVHIALKDYYTGSSKKIRTWAAAENNFLWNFAKGEPNNADTERCVEMNFQGKTWNNNICTNKFPFICEKIAETCPNGWTSFNGQCHYFSGNLKLDWFAARIKCQRLGATLVKIESQGENDWLYEKTDKKRAWIGLNSLGEEGFFTWANDLTYTNWESGKGGKDPKSGCVMANQYGKWRPYECERYVGTFICEYPIIDKKCGCARTQYQDKCYRFVSQKKTFSDANKYCSSNSQGNVMQITTPKLMELAMAMRPATDRWMWIGVVDTVSDGYYQTYPVQAKPFTKWAWWEPNNKYGSERCTELQKNGKWNDIPCTDSKYFVCEKKIGHSLYDL